MVVNQVLSRVSIFSSLRSVPPTIPSSFTPPSFAFSVPHKWGYFFFGGMLRSRQPRPPECHWSLELISETDFSLSNVVPAKAKPHGLFQYVCSGIRYPFELALYEFFLVSFYPLRDGRSSGNCLFHTVFSFFPSSDFPSLPC